MPIFNSSSINFEYVKVRWQEPYVSHALNRKLFGLLPKGVYAGFLLGPGNLHNRDIVITGGTVSGGLGTTLISGYVSGGFDETVGYSIAVHNDTNGYATTVSIPPSAGPFHLDATGLNGTRVYIALDASYVLQQATTARFVLVDGTQLNTTPSLIVLGFCDVPANPSTPLDVSMFGYNDPNFPRVTPLSTPQRAGYMPVEAWSKLNQFFLWENLCASTRDPNSNFVIDITPSQAVNSVTGARIYSYILANITSKFPRDSSGNYNGGVNNDTLTKLNIQTGAISGGHQIPGNTTFPTPPVVGNANSFQVGLVALDAGDGINVVYGNIFSSAALALKDDNLPIAGRSLFQICAFLCQTNGAGVLQPLGVGSILDRRPFLNVGGGAGSGDASTLLVEYTSDFELSNYSYFNDTVFNTDGSVMVDPTSTGVYDLVNNEFALNSGQFFLSKQNLSSGTNKDFLSQGLDVLDINLRVDWDLSFIDTAATYQVSRDGGLNYHNVSMSRIDSGGTFVGSLVFPANDVTTAVASYVSGNINASDPLNTSNDIQISQPFSLTAAAVLNQAIVFVSKTGNPGGSFNVQIVKDASGVPSSAPADTLAISLPIQIASLVSGTNEVFAILPSTVLQPGSYHLVISPDSVYRSSFISTVAEIDLRTNNAPSVPPLLRYNGTAWTPSSPAHGVIYYLFGRNLDLRVKVIAGTNTVKLAGYKIEYGPNSEFATDKLEQQTMIVDGSLNTSSFTVSEFLPNPKLLKVYWVETGNVYVLGAFSVNGQNVIFPPNTFNLPGQLITLIFDQTQGSAIDTSDANAGELVIHERRLDALGVQLDPVKIIDLPMIAVPHTTITNRAKILDLSNDLAVNMGVNRIILQDVLEVPDEVGPAGQRVWGALHDKLGQIRFVGTFWNMGFNDGNGFRPIGYEANDYVEVTFYGTGLNLLTTTNLAQDVRPTIDGGTEGVNFMPSGSSGVILGTTLGPNQIVNVCKGLTLGIHTIKLRLVTALNVFGFEFLNESDHIHINPGSYFVGADKLTLPASVSLPAVSGNFDVNYGTPGTHGGRVSIYLNPDGTIGRSVQWVGGLLLDINTDHSSEEEVRVFNWREFGEGRVGEFALANFGSSCAFTIDDNSTALSCSDASLINGGGPGYTSNFPEAMTPTNGSPEAMILSFIGTGVDIVFGIGVSNTAPSFSVIVDEHTTQTVSLGPVNNSVVVVKVASGLAYGTHTVRVVPPATGALFAGVIAYKIYQPKTPPIPAGSVLLANYNIVANYIANNTADPFLSAQGVIRRINHREFVYQNGTGGSGDWQFGAVDPLHFIGGWRVLTDRSGASFQLTFFGTGCEIRGYADTNLKTANNVTIDNLPATVGNFPNLVSSVYGGWAFSAGVLNQNGATTYGAGLSITGLPLGVHTIQVTTTDGTTATDLVVEAIDVITPIHNYKFMEIMTNQNTIMIGNQSVGDARSLSTRLAGFVGQGRDIFGSIATGSSGPTSMPDFSAIVNLTRSPRVNVNFSVLVQNSSVANLQGVLAIFVDSLLVDIVRNFGGGIANLPYIVPFQREYVVGLGVHKIQVYWYTIGGGSTNTSPSERYITVEEVL